MRSLRQLMRLRRWIAAGAIGALCLTMGVGTSFTALGQNQSSASANDVIFARKTLMATIARNMYPIDEMRQNGKYDLDKGRRDPAVDTFASPTVWKAYASFYKESQAASKIAFDLSKAQNEVEFRTK